MLNENEIVEAMCRDLTKSGYQILQKCSTTMKGIDIIAKHPSQPGRLLIEAKGGTSARSGSPRFDKGFNSSQVHDRVAKGLYAAARSRSAEDKGADEMALAFPDTERYRGYLEPIRKTLQELRIKVFLVKEDLSICLL